jgi:hypothetical protein
MVQLKERYQLDRLTMDGPFGSGSRETHPALGQPSMAAKGDTRHS